MKVSLLDIHLETRPTNDTVKILRNVVKSVDVRVDGAMPQNEKYQTNEDIEETIYIA